MRRFLSNYFDLLFHLSTLTIHHAFTLSLKPENVICFHKSFPPQRAGTVWTAFIDYWTIVLLFTLSRKRYNIWPYLQCKTNRKSNASCQAVIGIRAWRSPDSSTDVFLVHFPAGQRADEPCAWDRWAVATQDPRIHHTRHVTFQQSRPQSCEVRDGESCRNMVKVIQNAFIRNSEGRRERRRWGVVMNRLTRVFYKYSESTKKQSQLRLFLWTQCR